MSGMARTWLSITVELVEGRARTFWPRPGRALAAARSHTFADLALAVDEAFARWDLSHLHEFRLPDGSRIGQPDEDWGEPDAVLDDRVTKLSRLAPDEKFLYVFDFGDGWHHICTVGTERIDPVEVFGITPRRPLAYFGWGDIPDQYGRRFVDDDGEARVPANPHRTDLPPFFDWWGPGANRYRD
jgi:pRiA4b ORF-3-like protein